MINYRQMNILNYFITIIKNNTIIIYYILTIFTNIRIPYWKNTFVNLFINK